MNKGRGKKKNRGEATDFGKEKTAKKNEILEAMVYDFDVMGKACYGQRYAEILQSFILSL